MTKIALKVMARAVRLATAVAMAGLLWVSTPGQASAGFCSATNCSVTLSRSNFAAGGTFGTVTLTLLSHIVTVNVHLADAYRIIVGGSGKGNSPGAIAFADNVGGGLTINNFTTTVPSTPYSGSLSYAPGCTQKDCHWSSFGYANDAAATSGPKNSEAVQELSFNVSKGTSITDVHQLLQKFVPSGGNAPAYFTVDACIWNATAKGGCSGSGIVGAMRVPEPGSLALLASGLLALGLLRWKRMI